MTISINVNGLTLVHRDSGGTSRNTLPDVCKTPDKGTPLPYSNVSYSTDLAKGTTTVFADGGNSIANYGSQFARSTGDEQGSMGGIASGTHLAESDWISHSFDVFFEKKAACRLTDKMYMNHRNTVNMAGCIQKSLSPEELEQWLCKLACECFNLHQKGGAEPLEPGQTYQDCVQKKIMEECYDGRYPKPDSPVNTEVSYDRARDWDMVGSKADPNVPSSRPVVSNSRRMDIVVRDVVDGTIKKMYDMKFPEDPSGKGKMDLTRQKEYKKIARKYTGDGDNYESFEVDDRCKGCLEPAPAPAPSPAPAANPAVASGNEPENQLERVTITAKSSWSPATVAAVVVAVVVVAAVAIFAAPIVAAVGALLGFVGAIAGT